MIERESDLTLGEYLRRLRRQRKWSLHRVQEETGLSYAHLSRIENDSAVPGVDTIVKLADALGGNLPVMLDMANALPRQILDRLIDRERTSSAGTLHRAAGSAPQRHGEPHEAVVTSAQEAGCAQEEARELAHAFAQLIALPPDQRRAFVGLLTTLAQGARDGR